MSCTVHIDGRPIKSKKGGNLLWTALDNGIYIPNLCSIKGQHRPSASCRLCYVEIEGAKEPVTACTEIVRDGMVVRINSPRSIVLRRAAFALLLSNHDLDCAHCVKHRRCELQRIASFDRIKLNGNKYNRIPPSLPVDTSHALLVFNPNKCVLCGRCVWMCRTNGTGILDIAYRGIKTRVSAFAGMPLGNTDCHNCLACADICPVGSLYRKSAE